MTFSRYAVFFTLPDGPLAAFGNSWLGWDIAAGCDVPQPVVPGLPQPVAEVTQAARKYGLHATLKPPFALANGQDEATLRAAVERLSVQVVPVTLEGLRLVAMGRFLALVPVGDQAQLNGMAAMAVETLDTFRAPLTEAELARRAGAGLSPAHSAHVQRWGYPYVMDAFRFHITLTGKLNKADLDPVRRHLDQALAHVLPWPFAVNALSLVGQDADTGRFHLIQRFPLHM